MADCGSRQAISEARREWFCLEDDDYRPQLPDAQGVLHSRVFPGLQLPVAPLLAGDTAKVLAALTGHEPLNGKPPEASFKSQDTGSSYFSAILHSSFCLGCIHHSTFFILHSPQTCQTHRCEIRSCHEHTRVNRKGSGRDARAVTA
jgi:hypothetical protein